MRGTLWSLRVRKRPFRRSIAFSIRCVLVFVFDLRIRILALVFCGFLSRLALAKQSLRTCRGTGFRIVQWCRLKIDGMTSRST